MTTDPKECPIKQAGVGSTLPSPPAAPASPRAPAGDGEREVAEEDSSDLFFVAVAAWRSGVKGQCRQSIVRIAAVVAPFEGGEGKKRCAMWGNSGQIIVDVSPCLCFRRLKNPRYGTSPAKNKRRVIHFVEFSLWLCPEPVLANPSRFSAYQDILRRETTVVSHQDRSRAGEPQVAPP